MKAAEHRNGDDRTLDLSCGRRLTFLSGEGTTRRVHDFEDHPTFISPDGAHGVFIGFMEGGLAGWDAHGSPTWSIDSPPVESRMSRSVPDNDLQGSETP